MSADPTPAPQDDAEHYRRALRRLTDITLDIAEMIHAEATSLAETDANPLPALTSAAAAIDRLSRAVRRNAVTTKHLDDPAKPAPAERRAAARKRIIRDVEDAIHRSARSAPDKEVLQAELQERLDAPDLEDEIDDRPIETIIAEFIRDLGLAAAPGPQPWKRRTPDDLAALRARAARRPRPPNPRPPPNARSAGPPDAPERTHHHAATPNAA